MEGAGSGEFWDRVAERMEALEIHGLSDLERKNPRLIYNTLYYAKRRGNALTEPLLSELATTLQTTTDWLLRRDGPPGTASPGSPLAQLNQAIDLLEVEDVELLAAVARGLARGRMLELELREQDDEGDPA